jgi:hypothetical protein
VPDARLTGPVMSARVLDLSSAGAHIETATALRVGAPYAFTLEVAGVSRQLDGSVRWCRLVGTRDTESGDRAPVYRAGITWNPSEAAGS